MLHIREIAPTRSGLKEFVRFPLSLYQDDPDYVHPPEAQQIRNLIGRRNATVQNGVQCFLMAYDGQRPVGRVLAGIDFRVMQRLGERQGYISLFECIDDQAAANALFDAAKAFLKLNGITSVVGPNPAMFDDFGIGLLAEGFDTPPSFLSPYNPPYYKKLFEEAGFQKRCDYFSYDLPLESFGGDRYESVLARAGKRFGYTVENVNVQHDLKRRAREFARVIAESTPAEWEVIPPSSETLYRELKHLKKILWPEYILMAYAGERPIGLLLVIPDCQPLLRGLKGRLFPVGVIRMLFARTSVKRMRTVMLYVVPEYQTKGVEAVMIYRALQTAAQNGVKVAEASMINEQNLKMRLSTEKLGAKVAKVYRQYRLEI